MRDLIGHVKLSLDKNVIVNTANNDGIGVGGLRMPISIGRYLLECIFLVRKIFLQDNIFEKWSWRNAFDDD